MTKSLQALIATVLSLGLAVAAAPAGAAAPQVWGSPYGQQYMLQCLQQGGQVSTAPSGVVTCCIDGMCIACDGAEHCAVTIIGIPGDIAVPPQSAPAGAGQPATLPQMQLRIQR